MAFAHIAELVQDLRHSLGHGRLARARPTREGHVQAGGRRGEPHLLARSINDQQSRDFTDPRFHGFEADQLLVELIENVLNLGAFVGGLEINRRAVGLLR